MDYKNIAADFWENGYVVVEDVFDHAEMDRLNQVIVDNMGTTPEYEHSDEFLSLSKAEVVPWFPQLESNTDFDELGDHPVLQRLTAEILGEQWQEQYCMIMFSRQGSCGQAWHQDCAPEDAKQFNLNRLVYTHDVTDEIGGQTVVIPGTHRSGLIPAGDPEAVMDGQVVLTPKKGMLILLHGHCWHRVLPVHGEFRVSTNYRSAPKDTPEGITDVCVYRNMRYRFSTSEVIEERVAV